MIGTILIFDIIIYEQLYYRFPLLFFTSCNQTKNIEAILLDSNQSLSESSIIQKEIDELLAQDKKNKMLELEYLEQIRLAQENNDTEAVFEFFLSRIC